MDFLKNNKLNIVLIFCWFIIAAAGAYYHELWRDEAQVWQLAAGLSLPDLFKMSALEGHPPLWHFIMLPFAKIGASCCIMQIISLLAVLAAVIYFVFKAPFSYWIKIPAVFSAGMIYFLPALPRNYALIPIFMFIAADLFQKRSEHPYKFAAALILLSNTHVLTAGICAAAFLASACGNIKNALKDKNAFIMMPSVLVLCNFLFLAFYLQAASSNHAVMHYMKTAESFFISFEKFPLLFFEFHFIPDFICVLLFYSLFGIISAVLFKYSKEIFIIFISSTAYIFFVYSKIWFNGITGQKAYILLLCVLFCAWVFCCRYKSRIFNAAVSILFIISCINSFYAVPAEILYDFSGSKSTADYIKTNLNNEKIFCTIGAAFVFTPVSAYLPDKKFYSMLNKYYFSYHDFNSTVRRRMSAEPECRYFIVQRDFYMNDEYEIIYSSSDYIINDGEYAEKFDIYKKKAMI